VAARDLAGLDGLGLNQPSAIEEVRAAFVRYEQALVGDDVDALTASFLADERIVRFGIADRQRGARELARWRAAQPPLPAGRTLSETEITTFGSRFAVVSTLFTYPGRATVGRQSQAWVRADRWLIVHAHVSEV